MRRLINRRYRNPADPKVSHAQPPLHGIAGMKKRRQTWVGALVRLHLTRVIRPGRWIGSDGFDGSVGED
jgi:hypothetical protein